VRLSFIDDETLINRGTPAGAAAFSDARPGLSAAALEGHDVSIFPSDRAAVSPFFCSFRRLGRYIPGVRSTRPSMSHFFTGLPLTVADFAVCRGYRDWWKGVTSNAVSYQPNAAGLGPFRFLFFSSLVAL